MSSESCLASLVEEERKLEQVTVAQHRALQTASSKPVSQSCNLSLSRDDSTGKDAGMHGDDHNVSSVSEERISPLRAGAAAAAQPRAEHFPRRKYSLYTPPISLPSC